MVDKSTLGIIIFSSLVLLLTLRDVVLVKQTPGNKQTTDSDLNDDPSSPNLADERSFDDDFEHSAQEDSPKASQMNTDESDEKFVKTIPSLKMKGNIQTLKFMFCYSCGYRNMFEQYSQLIRQRFPDIKIVGENYPPATYKIYITQFISTLKLILIGMILFGQNPFAYFNIATPNLFTWATQNKMYACLMIFFLSNAIETQLITTGAFEIYLNDIQIWSKLESDRMPHEKELMQILDMNFNFESQKKAAFGSDSF